MYKVNGVVVEIIFIKLKIILGPKLHVLSKFYKNQKRVKRYKPLCIFVVSYYFFKRFPWSGSGRFGWDPHGQ